MSRSLSSLALASDAPSPAGRGHGWGTGVSLGTATGPFEEGGRVGVPGDGAGLGDPAAVGEASALAPALGSGVVAGPPGSGEPDCAVARVVSSLPAAAASGPPLVPTPAARTRARLLSPIPTASTAPAMARAA